MIHFDPSAHHHAQTSAAAGGGFPLASGAAEANEQIALVRLQVTRAALQRKLGNDETRQPRTNQPQRLAVASLYSGASSTPNSFAASPDSLLLCLWNWQGVRDNAPGMR
jgi:hypothetical protein